MEGRQLISREEMTAKIRAAVHARRDPDTVLISRTDAVAVTGFDDACQRAAACRDAGADVIFVEALQTPEQIQSAAARVGAPLTANMVEHGKTPWTRRTAFSAWASPSPSLRRPPSTPPQRRRGTCCGNPGICGPARSGRWVSPPSTA